MVEKVTVIDEEFGRNIDRLPDGKRDIVESVASAIMWKIIKRLVGYVHGSVKILEEKGLKVDVDVNIDRIKRGCLAVIRLELNDIDPGKMLRNRRFIVKSVSDKWLRWALTRILIEIAEEEVDETIAEAIAKDLGIAPKIEDKVVVGRIPLEPDENENENNN